MTSLKEIQDEVAKESGFQNWKHMDQNSTLTENPAILEKVFKRIWQRAAEAQREACAKAAFSSDPMPKMTISNCPLVTLTD